MPTSSEPTGAPRPLDRQTDSTSATAPYSASGVPVATCAFQIRAPSRWIADADAGGVLAQVAQVLRAAAPLRPAKLWVFSTEMAAVRTKNGPMSGAKIVLIVGRSTWPRGWIQVRIVRPV